MCLFNINVVLVARPNKGQVLRQFTKVAVSETSATLAKSLSLFQVFQIALKSTLSLINFFKFYDVHSLFTHFLK